MSGTEDLKELLGRLKDEVGPLPPEPLRAPETAARRRAEEEPPRPRLPAVRPERFNRAFRGETQRELPDAPPHGNPAWNENKEIMLFGALTALVALLGGILAGLDYLVLIGAVVFLLFSFMMLLHLFGHYLTSRRGITGNQGLAERVDALSRRIEMLSTKAVSGAGPGYAGTHPDRERELEHKVEELRVLVKTLAKSVERQD